MLLKQVGRGKLPAAVKPVTFVCPFKRVDTNLLGAGYQSSIPPLRSSLIIHEDEELINPRFIAFAEYQTLTAHK